MGIAGSIGVLISIVLTSQFWNTRRDVTRMVDAVAGKSSELHSRLVSALVRLRRMRIIGQLIGYWGAAFAATEVLPLDEHGDPQLVPPLLAAIAGSLVVGIAAGLVSLLISARPQDSDFRIAQLEPRSVQTALSPLELLLRNVIGVVIVVTAFWALALAAFDSQDRVANFSIGLAALVVLIGTAGASLAESRLVRINPITPNDIETTYRSTLIAIAFRITASNHLRVLSMLGMLFTFWIASQMGQPGGVVFGIAAFALPLSATYVEVRRPSLAPSPQPVAS